MNAQDLMALVEHPAWKSYEELLENKINSMKEHLMVCSATEFEQIRNMIRGVEKAQRIIHEEIEEAKESKT